MKLIILDRDGVINKESRNYIRNPDEWIALPKSLDAIAKLTQASYTISVATNQSGVARGYYTEETLAAIHDKMHKAVEAAGGRIDTVFHCPHHPDEGCFCRKPNPGMLLKIAEHYQTSLADVYMVGDRDTDIEVAHNAGAKPVLLTQTPTDDIPSFERLWDFVLHLLK